jgi:hypothetical protein
MPLHVLDVYRAGFHEISSVADATADGFQKARTHFTSCSWDLNEKRIGPWEHRRLFVGPIEYAGPHEPPAIEAAFKATAAKAKEAGKPRGQLIYYFYLKRGEASRFWTAVYDSYQSDNERG